MASFEAIPDFEETFEAVVGAVEGEAGEMIVEIEDGMPTVNTGTEIVEMSGVHLLSGTIEVVIGRDGSAIASEAGELHLLKAEVDRQTTELVMREMAHLAWIWIEHTATREMLRCQQYRPVQISTSHS